MAMLKMKKEETTMAYVQLELENLSFEKLNEFMEELEITECIKKSIKQITLFIKNGNAYRSIEKPEDLINPLATKINSLPLSPRTLNALTYNKIVTIGHLIKYIPESLANMSGIGPKGLSDIQRVLKEQGLKLGGENNES